MIFAVIAAVAVASSVASLAYSYYQGKKAEKAAKALASSGSEVTLSTPTVDEGKLLPVVFGTRRLNEPFLAWFDREADISTDKAVSAQLAICYGPITNLMGIYLDDRMIWAPLAWDNSENFSAGNINLSTYPFSDDGKFSGQLRFFSGNNNPADPLLQSKVGYDVTYPNVCGALLNNVNVGTAGNLRSLKFKIYRQPDSTFFPGIATISTTGSALSVYVFAAWERIGGFIVGALRIDDPTKANNAMLTYGIRARLGDSFSDFRLLDTPTTAMDGYFYRKTFTAAENDGGVAEIGVDRIGKVIYWAVNCAENPFGKVFSAATETVRDANPAAIIAECLQNDDWGMANPWGFDANNFKTAGQTLFDEGFGLSVKWEKSSTIEEFVKQILTHIDALLYIDRATGKIKIRLMRGDYNELEILNFDVSTIEEVSAWKRTSPADLINTVTVTYYDSRRNASAGVTVYDAALVNSMGTTVSQTYDFPAITTKENALRVAKRELASVANPIIAASFSVPLTVGKDLKIGDVVRVTYPKYSAVPIVFRVQKLDFGDGRKNSVNITGVQDIYSFQEMK